MDRTTTCPYELRRKPVKKHFAEILWTASKTYKDRFNYVKNSTMKWSVIKTTILRVHPNAAFWIFCYFYNHGLHTTILVDMGESNSSTHPIHVDTKRNKNSQ